MLILKFSLRPEVYDGRSAVGASVVAALYPLFETGCVEVVPVVTPQLCNRVRFLVIHQAYGAAAFVLAQRGIIICPRQGCQNHGHLCLPRSSRVGSRGCLLSDRHVETRDCTEEHQIYKTHEVANKEDDEHE